ncbi:DUF3048 domain-containing protein [Anaeromicropila populeti]|uniref:DUF3048 domain-containing protein n=1 Tax=Anaeromicropila populeti TaxID=37658 RepID=A0A1I6KYD6_9FIRM|nr:DUF3048 domain-containing protein [Anaeromicropila populeti]SFR96211.1 Protein of unknown function [Anaeromicropila populeti]
MKSKRVLITVGICFLFLLMGCGKKNDIQKNAIIPLETAASATIQTPVPTVEPEQPDIEQPVLDPDMEGKAQSTLTGLWVDKELVAKRPYAIMINNIKAANPQSGISQASILYEAVVEGGITRLMGIFEDFDSKRIGSVRSARHYFCSFADEYDAIFVHYGQTKYAISKMEELGTDNLSGLEGVGTTVFYRDNSIQAPHNAFASYEGILKGTKEKKYRTERSENTNPFTFNESDIQIDGKDAKKVSLGYSNYTTPYFTYDEQEKVYKRFQFGGPHIDKSTGEQLTFKNIIIQLVKEWDIDKNGYQTMDIEQASGSGYYLTNGKVTEITWTKNEDKKERVYYDKDGNELKLNVGKTFISVFPRDRSNKISFSQ